MNEARDRAVELEPVRQQMVLQLWPEDDAVGMYVTISGYEAKILEIGEGMSLLRLTPREAKDLGRALTEMAVLAEKEQRK